MFFCPEAASILDCIRVDRKTQGQQSLHCSHNRQTPGGRPCCRSARSLEPSSCHLCGAPMYREDQKLALQKLGHVLVQYYGLGEVTGNITVLRPQDHFLEDGPETRSGTCGTERTGIEVSIQDEDGNHLPPMKRVKSASSVRQSVPAIWKTKTPTRSLSGTAGSAPETSVTWMNSGTSS